MKKIASLVLASVFGGALALGGFFLLNDQTVESSTADGTENNPRVFQTNYIPTSRASLSEDAIDFTNAAEETVNAVVHVKNKAVKSSNPLEEFFYGRSRSSGERRIVGTGSGVIISPDGYIVTNNHVIRGAEDVEITLNNQKTYSAKIVGAHSNSDIALLKIDDDNLPFVSFANSDNVRVGEWVLAVGNPFNLTSTVTAGIVSAKGRDINISNPTMIESFIQTDAAVNPGNSGGALVNVRGELVGINTAITSQTGSYVGYSFAVPSNIAKKVVEDIMEFGDVQKAYIGIIPADLDSKEAQEFDLGGATQGVLITRITENGGAKEAGIRVNDIITRVGNVKVNKFADLQGYLSTKRPGDVIAVTVLRGGAERDFSVKLKNQFSKLTYDKFDYTRYHLGQVRKINNSSAEKLSINYGVEVTRLNDDIRKSSIKEGDIILKVNEAKVYDADSFESLLRSNKGREVILEVLKSEDIIHRVRMIVQG